MLRPTYNFDKILGWLFVYGAIIKYAEQNATKAQSFYRSRISLETILRSVYSEELANILCEFLRMSERIVFAQTSVRDSFGMRVDIEDKVINYNTFGRYFY
jgi:hypothetical protein